MIPLAINAGIQLHGEKAIGGQHKYQIGQARHC